MNGEQKYYLISYSHYKQSVTWYETTHWYGTPVSFYNSQKKLYNLFCIIWTHEITKEEYDNLVD